MKKEASYIVCIVSLVIGALLILSSLCCFIFFRDAIIRVPMLAEKPLSALELTKANAESNALVSGLSSNRLLFLVLGICCVLFSALVYLLIRRQKKLFPESYGEIMKKIRHVFIAVIGALFLGCGLYGLITYTSYHFESDFASIQSGIRSVLPAGMYLQDRIKLVSISNYPALIITGICVLLFGVLFYYLWTKQEKIDKRINPKQEA